MNPKIKDVLGVALTVAVLIAAFAGWKYAQGLQPGAYREFSASGEGKVVAVPDVAQFTFSVITEGGTNLAALQSDNTGKTNKAIDFIKSKGVGKKDIKTTSYNVEPRYQYYSCGGPVPLGSGAEACPPPSITGYTITQVVSVKVRDFSKVGDIMAGVVTSGANQVSSLVFTLDDPDKAKNDARAEAIAKARAQAEAMAKAGGFRLGKLVSIDEAGGIPPYYYGRGGDAGITLKEAAAPAPAIEPGSQDITVQVTLRYQIR